MKVVLSTEDINSYGFWVLTSGIMLDRFKKNPVLTLNHDTWNMSVGKINDIRVENGQLVGEVEFDEGDDQGKELKRKYEKGYMNGFSIGIKVLTWSEESMYLKEGQTRASAIKSELMEIAAATVPSNSNAVKLYDADGKILNLSAIGIGEILPQIKKESNMKQIALSLGLPENATEKEINAKIAELQAKREAETKAPETGNLAEVFLSLGTSKGVINDSNKEDFNELYKTNPTLAIRMLSHFEAKKEEKPSAQKTETLTSIIEKLGNAGTPKTEKKWNELSDQELENLRENDRAAYAKLYTAYYGHAPKF
jgi:HK97 family phage prohead protease